MIPGSRAADREIWHVRVEKIRIHDKAGRHDSQATGSGRNSMAATSPNGMFPMRVFQIVSCGTYLIARSGTYTVKDCRTEQRARWDKIRWRAQMQREQEERKATVQRWKERRRMQREDKDVVDGMMADGRVPDDGP